MSREQKIESLRELLAKLHAYEHAQMILQYDAATVMPAEGAEEYSRTVGLLSEESYQLLTGERLGELMNELKDEPELPPELGREIEELERDRRRISVIPLPEYVEFSTLQSRSGAVWREAKGRDDYAAFKPYLTKVIDYTKRFALYFQPDQPVYDTLLDEYERGLSQAGLDPFFQRVHQEIGPLIADIGAVPAPDDSFLKQNFPLAGQKLLSSRLMELLALPHRRCALGETEHPFTTGANNRDVRITTHYFEDDLAANLFSVIHEGGHALYMLHIDDKLNGLRIGDGASMAMHESQSRLFENMIGRSQPFLGFLWPELLGLFPAQLAEVDPQSFYRAVNKSRPSLIRINADELTYPLHVMVRYELEKAIFNGDLNTDELPAAWRDMYREYLGVAPEDDRSGVLQDSHWSDGSFGYFPTYALGSAYAAQLMAAMERETDIWAAVAQGDLAPAREWLEQRVWRWGALKQPAQLLREATGADFDPAYYTDYLKGKFSSIYGLS